MRNRKILLISNQFFPDIGGIQTFSTDLAEFLSEHYSNIYVCVFKGHRKRIKHHDYALFDMLIPLAELRFMILYYFINSLKILFLVSKIRPDVVISTNYFPTSLFIIVPKIIFSMKHIIYIHGSEVFQAKSNVITKCLSKIVDSISDIIIINSSYSQKLLNDFFKNINLDVIPPILPTRYELIKCIARTRSMRPEITIVSVCHIIEKKGIQNVLMALKEFKNLNIRYFIIGEGKYLSNLKKIVDHNFLNDIVNFKGELPNENVIDIFNDADIFIMPTYTPVEEYMSESFGIVYFEALASNLHVIASKESGGPDLKNFFGDQIALVDPYDIKDIINKLKYSIKEKKIYNSEKNVKNFLYYISEKWLNLIDELANDNN